MSRIDIRPVEDDGTSEPLWKALVYQRIKELGSIQKVADELGYARPSLSLALRDKYVGDTKKLESTVIRVLGYVMCPYLNEKITPQQCGEYRNIEAPTHNPARMRHWRHCQQCKVPNAIQPREKKWQI